MCTQGAATGTAGALGRLQEELRGLTQSLIGAARELTGGAMERANETAEIGATAKDIQPAGVARIGSVYR